MIIENPEAFKSWLTSILEPLCDADPAALAKYVYALVKKDKPIEELRDGMLDQLDVFLQHETKAFVSMLFKSLETNDYLKVEDKKPTSPTEAVQAESEEKKETEPENQADPLTAPNGTPQEEVRPRNRSPVTAVPNPPRHRVVVNRGPNKPGLIVTARAPPQEQTLVKLIPLNELLDEPIEQVPRRRDRRGDSLRDKDDRRRRRSRSWERRARTRRHRDDVNERNYDKRRPVSRSPSPRGRYRNRSPPNANNDRPHSRSRSRSPAPNHDRERLRVPRELERDRISRDREHRDRGTRDVDRERSRDRSLSPHDDKMDHLNQIGYKKRCRDFDEKGYCMRGDLCQWDHGVDPVVVDDLTRVISMPPTVPEYNPLAPDIWCGTGGPAYPPHHLPPHPMSNRELIPIPTAREPPIPGAPPIPPPIRHSAPPKKLFDYNRLGNQRPPMGSGGNCSLEVKKVPRGMNDITHLNNHFGKFGKIVNIQVCYEGDPEAALITFSNHTEANVAYKSTEAVLNNRFIKVFWHNHENKQENTAPSGQQMNKQNNGHNSHTMSQHKVLINRDNIKATADNKQQQIEKQVAKEPANGQDLTKKEAPKPMDKVKRVMESHKRAQALLETQLQQQQVLIQKMESGNLTEAKKMALMEAIKSTQEGIEKLSRELLTYKDTLKLMQVKKPKTREEAQKEILDAELDMFNKQQEGQDVTELVKKIAELRKQMAIQFPVHPRGLSRIHSRGGRFNPTSRINRIAPASKVFVNQSVDHRPRAVLISGFEPDELDALVAHFSQYGEVTGKEVNLSVPELILQYRARAHAELAAAHGRNYSDRTLSITWVSNSKPIAPISAPPAKTPAATPAATPTANAATNATATAAAQNGDFDVALTTQHDTKMTELSESLLRFDEEDEEEAEDRSWRR